MLDTQALYQQILAFRIDDSTPELPFEARLAQENGGCRAYTQRVIVEYKRFLYLAMTAGHVVTPSEEVDQAWHMHLTYTRSYWERLCRDLLGRPLHHCPTQGGAEELHKYRALYEQTLASYRAAFGEEPPADVWPPVDVRFGKDPFVRINGAAYWVVPKAPIRRAAFAAAAVVGAVLVTGCAGGGNLNPFALRGVEFLWVLIPALVVAAGLGLVIREWQRGPGPQPADEQPELNWEEATYLAAEDTCRTIDRLTQATIARLVARNAARVSEDGYSLQLGAEMPHRLSLPEETVLAALPLQRSDPSAYQALKSRVRDAFAKQASKLQEAGYLLAANQLPGIGCAALLPAFLVLVTLGLPRLALGLEKGKPVLFLVLTIAVGVVLSILVVVARLNRLTRRGKHVLQRLRQDNRELGTQTESELAESAGLAVALFGPTILTGSLLAPLAVWYPRRPGQVSGGDGGCGASGCGGGGGCGGGCGGGGCGGCGGG
jgi:uncharacterized protein (TIGR04222 family)